MIMKTILLFLMSAPIFTGIGLKQVANYSVSDYGNPQYEAFSFWINEKNEPFIQYFYGENEKEVKVKYLGKAIIGNVACFKMVLNNNLILYASQEKNKLRVKNTNGTYNKLFNWKYEGPMNGIGTFCQPCTEDEKKSKDFITKYYMK